MIRAAVPGFGRQRISWSRLCATMPVRRLNEISIFVMLMITAPLQAQWLDHPTPGIPRTANGKPNLSALAPKTSEFVPFGDNLKRVGAQYL
jgi:hypothetical protein